MMARPVGFPEVAKLVRPVLSQFAMVFATADCENERGW